MACATEMSDIYDTNSIDAHLQSKGMKRVSVPSDGHCILHSWRLGLDELNIKYGHKQLLQMGVEEISNNLSFYGEFLPNEDLLSQLKAYAIHQQYESTGIRFG